MAFLFSTTETHQNNSRTLSTRDRILKITRINLATLLCCCKKTILYRKRVYFSLFPALRLENLSAIVYFPTGNWQTCLDKIKHPRESLSKIQPKSLLRFKNIWTTFFLIFCSQNLDQNLTKKAVLLGMTITRNLKRKPVLASFAESNQCFISWFLLYNNT